MKKNRGLKLGFVLLLLTWFVSHIPFLTADADIHIRTGGSRGSWSDEGLYTSQIRNFLNHGSFHLLESDAVLKTPLLSAYLLTPFAIFGTNMQVARLATLLFISVSLSFFTHRKKTYGIVSLLLLTTLMFFPIHQYSHIAMAEIFGTILLLVSSLFFSAYIHNLQRHHLFFTYLSLVFAVLFKIQFLYVLAIPVAGIFLTSLWTNDIALRKGGIESLVILISVVLILFLIWFLPFQNEWRSILYQESGIFFRTTISIDSLIDNIIRNFLVRGYLPFTAVFLAAVVWSILNLAKNKYGDHTKGLIIFNLVWFAAELHKLPMDYLPVRYLISFYLSMGMLISIVIADLIFEGNKNLVKYVAVSLVTGLVIVNSYHYFRSLGNRQYSITKINQYIASHTNPEDIIIGTWATSSNWEGKNLAIPIWHQFLLSENPIEKFKARIVVSEPDERESDFAYINREIDLTEVADSTRQFRLAYWTIDLHWMSKK